MENKMKGEVVGEEEDDDEEDDDTLGLGSGEDDKKKKVSGRKGSSGGGSSGGGSMQPSCQVDNCSTDMTYAKPYHRQTQGLRISCQGSICCSCRTTAAFLSTMQQVGKP